MNVSSEAWNNCRIFIYRRHFYVGISLGGRLSRLPYVCLDVWDFLWRNGGDAENLRLWKAQNQAVCQRLGIHSGDTSSTSPYRWALDIAVTHFYQMNNLGYYYPFRLSNLRVHLSRDRRPQSRFLLQFHLLHSRSHHYVPPGMLQRWCSPRK